MPVIPRLRSEHGFTLIELLVAMVTGLVVVGAAFTILEVSLRQSTRIADKVSADQRGRVGLEKVMQELHSTCVAIGVDPIYAGSTGTKLIFQSQAAGTAAEPTFVTGLKHEIVLTETKLLDKVFKSSSGTEAAGWIFPATPSETVTLLTNVYPPTSGSTFEYFRYASGNLATPVTEAELTKTNVAKTVAKVNVNLLVAPESNDTRTGRSVSLSSSAVLRLTPSNEKGFNEPCQ